MHPTAERGDRSGARAARAETGARRGWLARPHDGSPLPRWKLAVFALPGVALRAGSFPLFLYVPALYSEEFGLSLAAVGLVFTAIRFADMAWDPAIAILLDKTHTRFGRRRPWVVAATPILLLAIALVYLPGSVAGDRVTPLYLFAGLAVLYVGQSFYGLAHGAWGAELSSDYHERSRIQAFAEWISTAGGVAILTIPIFFEVFVDAERMSPRVAAMAWFALVAIPLSVVANVLLVPERPATPAARTGFLPAVRLLFNNPYLVRIAAIDALYGLQVGVSSGLMVFFVKYWIGVPEGTTAVVFISQTGTLAAIPLWARLSRRIGKHRAVGVAYAVHLLAHCLYPLIGAGDIALYWALALVGGLGGASAAFLLRSITVDIVDYDNWRSGEERTALFFAVLSTTARIAPSIAVGITFPLLAFLGFDPSAAKPDAHAIQALRWVYIAVPILAMGGAAWLLRGFRLDEGKQRELRRAIEARGRAGASPAGPHPGGRGEPEDW